MKTLKNKNSKKRTIRKAYHGGNRKQVRNAVNLAIANLNAVIINPDHRKIVKTRLSVLYGSSETWRILRNPPVVYPDADKYNSLPNNIKLFIQALTDRLIELFALRGNLEYDYNTIIIELIKNDLYKKTQKNANNTNSNIRSNNYNSNSENVPFAGVRQTNGTNGSNANNPS